MTGGARTSIFPGAWLSQGVASYGNKKPYYFIKLEIKKNTSSCSSFDTGVKIFFCGRDWKTVVSTYPPFLLQRFVKEPLPFFCGIQEGAPEGTLSTTQIELVPSAATFNTEFLDKRANRYFCRKVFLPLVSKKFKIDWFKNSLPSCPISGWFRKNKGVS